MLLDPEHAAAKIAAAREAADRESVDLVVNARTGEVVGTRPYSFWKPALIVLAILAIIGAIAGIMALVGAISHGSPPI